MKIIDCDQGTPEWFAARLGIATASCYADILARGKGAEESASRRNYRLRLVLERLTGRQADGYKSPAMQRGTELEPLARAAYESRTGAFVDLVGLIRHDDIETGASPDGLIDSAGGVEIKAPEAAAHLDYLRLPEGTAPAKYVAQIQGQLWVAEREWIDFVSFNPDFPPHLQLVIRRVRRDEKYIAGLTLAVSLFMDEVREEAAAVLALPVAA